ncbi:hypothetical protein D3C87_1895560 [compost metagenome]
MACSTLKPQTLKKLLTSQSARPAMSTGSRRLAQKYAATATINPDMLAMFSTCTSRSSNGITALFACLS